MGSIICLVYGTKDTGGGLIFSMYGKWGGGGKLMYGKGVGSGDIIRKYTFECGARPAGSASMKIKS